MVILFKITIIELVMNANLMKSSITIYLLFAVITEYAMLISATGLDTNGTCNRIVIRQGLSSRIATWILRSSSVDSKLDMHTSGHQCGRLRKRGAEIQELLILDVMYA